MLAKTATSCCSMASSTSNLFCISKVESSTVLSRKQEQMNLPNYWLLQDVVTHWNFMFLMFQQLLEQRWEIYAVFNDKHGT